MDTDPSTECLLGAFKDLEIFLVNEGGFYYASGGIGPYYIDLRRGPNDPKILQHFIDAYSKGLAGLTLSAKPAFVGVPTTGVVYATGLALAHDAPLVVMEKLNPERAHIFAPDHLRGLATSIRADPRFDISTSAFLGLEDMGVVLSTAAGLTHGRPSAILRRTAKGHGTSKTVEASLSKWAHDGIKSLVVFNDCHYPLTEDEVVATLASIPAFASFGLEVHLVTLAMEELSTLPPSTSLVEVEDLWTTGTSAIKLNFSIQKVFGVTPSVLVFLDREQGAMAKFQKLGIQAKAIYPIRQIAKHLADRGWIEAHHKENVIDYVAAFEKPSFMEKLVALNESCLCVGIDICHAKLPEAGDTTLPGDPYPQTTAGVVAYVSDLMDHLSSVPEIKVIKPNLAYYNSLTDTDLHHILDLIHTKAKEFGWLVILDTKIGDIARTQAQYAEKYKEFDAVTVHGYMGIDSIAPVTDAGLGAYALVFTSNPSRVDVETLPTFDISSLRRAYEIYLSTCHGPEATFENLHKCLVEHLPKVYHAMAQRIIDWQFAGTVGAVIGGTRSSDGTLKELEEIVRLFGKALGYLPPLLIPGVGTQGGSATEVIHAIVKALQAISWPEDRIRRELRKVSINSSSAIDYSPRPADAARELAQEIREAIESAFDSIGLRPTKSGDFHLA